MATGLFGAKQSLTSFRKLSNEAAVLEPIRARSASTSKKMRAAAWKIAAPLSCGLSANSAAQLKAMAKRGTDARFLSRHRSSPLGVESGPQRLHILGIIGELVVDKS